MFKLTALLFLCFSAYVQADELGSAKELGQLMINYAQVLVKDLPYVVFNHPGESEEFKNCIYPKIKSQMESASDTFVTSIKQSLDVIDSPTASQEDKTKASALVTDLKTSPVLKAFFEENNVAIVYAAAELNCHFHH